jgi:hypothetical protein
MEDIQISVVDEKINKLIDKMENEQVSDIKLTLNNAISIYKEIITTYNAQSLAYDETESRLSKDLGNLIYLHNRLT